MSFVQEGGCQCGAVRYRVTEEPVRVALCHCEECQSQSGSAFGMSMIVPESGFALLKGTLKTWSRTAESGRTVDCLFCPECGNRILHKAQAYAGYVNVKPGTLDDRSWLAPTASIWMGKKQPWVTVPEGLFTHDAQP